MADPIYQIPGDYPNLTDPGNIDIANRPVVNNPDGTVSTELSMGINEDGKEVLIPQIVNAQRVSPEEAIAHYKATGEHLGKFSDVESANVYAKNLHNRFSPPEVPNSPLKPATPQPSSVLPAADATAVLPTPGVGDVAPPSWKEIRESPEFQNLDRQKQLVTFDRWHQNAYNYASAQPGWDGEVEKAFNQSAYETQQKLQSAAGMTADQARYQLAKTAIASGRTADQLPPDLKATLDNPPPDTGFFHQLLNMGRVAGSDVGSFVEHGLAGVASSAAASLQEQANNPAPVDKVLNFLADPFNQQGATKDENVKQAADMLNGVADYWNARAKTAGAESQVDPKLEDTWQAKAAHLLSGGGRILTMAAIPEVGIPTLLATNSMARYGEVMDQTGDPAKAEVAKNASLVGDSLFIGVGGAMTEGLEKVLPEGMPALRKWATKVVLGTGGNVTVGQLIKAGTAAAEADPDQRMSAFTNALSELTGPDAINAAAFAIAGTLPHGAAQEPVEAKVDANAAKVGPETAAADAASQAALTPDTTISDTGKVINPTNPNPTVDTEPSLSLGDATRGDHGTLNIPEGATVQQLNTLRAQIKDAPLPEQAKALHDATIQQEIDRRTSPSPANVAAAAAITPESQAAASTQGEGGGGPTDKLTPREDDFAVAYKPKARTQEEGKAELSPEELETFRNWKAAVAQQRAKRLGQAVSTEEAVVPDKAVPHRVIGGKVIPDIVPGGEGAGPVRTVVPEKGPLAPTTPVRPVEAYTPHEPPTAEEVKAQQTFEKKPPRSPEEIQGGINRLRRKALQQGSISRADVWAEVGQKESSPVLEQIRGELDKAYPVQTEPPPTTTAAAVVKHPVVEVGGKRASLPTINEKGVIRPMYTNDPTTTALQIDQNGTENRIYINRKLVENDQVNPAIDYSFEKMPDGTTRAYVTGVDTKYGRIDQPNQYTEAYKADPAVAKASAAQTKGAAFQLTPETDDFQARLQRLRDKRELTSDETTRLAAFRKYADFKLAHLDDTARTRITDAVTDKAEEQVRRFGADKGLKAPAQMVRAMEADYVTHVKAGQSLEALAERGVEPSEEGGLRGTEAAREQEEGATGQKAHDALMQELVDRGIDEGIMSDYTEGGIEIPQSKGKGITGEKSILSKNLDALDNIGLLPKRGETVPNRIGRALGIISIDKSQPQYIRDLAKRLLTSKQDWKTLEFSLMRDATDGSPAGQYDPREFAKTGKGKLILNPEGVHPGHGIVETFVHELGHHVTLQKLRPTYARNPIEEKAYQGLQKAFQKTLGEVFKKHFGIDGSSEELELFRKAQSSNRTEAEAAQQELGDITGTNPGLIERQDYYGISSLHEFAAEAIANERFRDILSKISADKPEGKIATLLDQIHRFFKNLFVGETVTPGSELDKTLDHIFTLAKTPAERTKLRTPEQAGFTKLKKISRSDLEAQARELGTPESLIAEMTDKELKNSLENRETVQSTEPVEGSGWLGPKGEKINAPVDIGAHAQALKEHLDATDPKAAAELEDYVTSHKDDASPLSIEDVYQWANKKGFLHIHDDGQTVYFSGNPKPSQLRTLIDSAKATGRTLIHDLSDTSSLREKTVYSPDQVLAAKAGKQEPPTVRLATTLRGGKLTHELRIEPNATTQDLLDFQDQINKSTALTTEDKNELNAQISEKTGPVLSYFGRGGGRDKVIAGANRLDTESNVVARQAANRLAQLFGGKKPTATDLQDRQAMPFVVEAGGKLSEVINDIDRMANSKTPEEAKPFVALAEYARENFDRLNKLVPEYNAIMKERLERENAHGMKVGELENYVSRPNLQNLNEKDNSAMAMFTGKAGGPGTRYFIKGRTFDKLSDAIAEGYIPQSKGRAGATDIVDLTQRRVEAGERLVQRKILTDELRGAKAQDGKPIVSVTPSEKYTTTTGGTDTRVPHGYQTVLTGGQPLVVHNDYARLFKALYGDSNLPEAATTLIKAAGFLKRYTLMLDTYHIGRMMFKEAAYSKGLNRFGWNKALSILEYRDADMDKAVKLGDLSQRMVDYAREKMPIKTPDGVKQMSRRDIADLLIHHGLNVGRVADNLWKEHTIAVPGLKNFNPWVFQKLSRGAMLQTAIENFVRNSSRFTERGVEGNARQTAKEYNEVFGNLQKESMFKNPNYQNALRAVFLAPQWAESQLKAEGRGIAQSLRGIGELATGKARLGTVAQGQLTVIGGMLAANQLINYITRGHTTFENKEHGHQLDAYIPDFIGGGKKGFWFNPFEIGGEYSFMAQKYFAQHMTPTDIISQILSNKLSNLGRSAKDLLSGRDWSQRKFENYNDNVKAALADLLPLPMPATGVLEKDPRQPWSGHIEHAKSVAGIPLPGQGIPVPLPPGYRLSRAPGATEKQVLQGAGLKVAYESSPAAEMFQLAHAYRKDGGHDDPTPYKELRQALTENADGDVQTELKMLADRGHTFDQIRSAVGITPSGTITPIRFTGGKVDQERVFVKSLTPEQKELWQEAQKDNRDNAKKLKKAIGELKAQDPEFAAKLRANKKPIQPEP